MNPRQNPHNLRTSCVYLNLRANCVKNINAIKRFQLPRPASERIRRVGQGAHRADVNQIARNLARDHPLDIRSDLG